MRLFSLKIPEHVKCQAKIWDWRGIERKCRRYIFSKMKKKHNNSQKLQEEDFHFFSPSCHNHGLVQDRKEGLYPNSRNKLLMLNEAKSIPSYTANPVLLPLHVHPFQKAHKTFPSASRKKKRRKKCLYVNATNRMKIQMIMYAILYIP